MGRWTGSALSVEARYLQALGRDATVPEDGYHGEYVAGYAADILATEGPGLADLPPEERFVRMRTEGAERAMAGMRATLARFGIVFDTYVSEASLADKGEIGQAVERLTAAGATFEADGALWFRSTGHGDDKDRVLIRSNGQHTYFAADCAYVIDKFGRGFDHLLYVWGADHHGDVVRVTAAATVLGYDPARLELLLYQFVTFLRGGEPVKMSKRAGTFVTLDELMDEVGADAARFHLLLFSNDHAMNFDIEEVARATMDNPVYYVQYAPRADRVDPARRRRGGPAPRPGRRPRAADARGRARSGAGARGRARRDREGGRAPRAPSPDPRRAGPGRALPPVLHREPRPDGRRRARPRAPRARGGGEADARDPARPRRRLGARADGPRRRLSR